MMESIFTFCLCVCIYRRSNKIMQASSEDRIDPCLWAASESGCLVMPLYHPLLYSARVGRRHFYIVAVSTLPYIFFNLRMSTEHSFYLNPRASFSLRIKFPRSGYRVFVYGGAGFDIFH